jgi:flagellin
LENTMPAINTNISALKAQSALASNARTMTSAMEKLSTGNRVNSAKDDAAGLAIGTTMTSQIRGLNQAVRNANDGVNLLQTAEGAMVEQTNMLQRMRELAVQSVNATNSDSQRAYLNTEFAELTSQISNIGTQTKWNTTTVLASASLTFQVGVSSDTTFTVTIADTTTGSTGLAIDLLAIASAGGATAALATIDSALDTVNGQRAQLGATMNRLTYTADNLSNVSANLAASRSNIMDTEYATASSDLSRAQIIQQAATAMLAQANQQPQSVLALLK